MSLLYRSVWLDDRPNLLAEATAVFGRWLEEKKRLHVSLDDEATIATDGQYGPIEVRVRRASDGGTAAVQLALVEERPGSGERWTTTLTTLTEPGEVQHCWVDLERVADDPSRQLTAPAPGLVRMLIETGQDPRVDQVRLTTQVHPIAGKPLAGLIRHPDRTLPIIAFSHDAGFDASMTKNRAERTLHHLMGAAQVFVLSPEEAVEFRATIGDELAVWSGSARLYLPNRDADGLRPERHRYVLASRLGVKTDQPARMFSGMLRGIVPARRAPRGYEAVRTALRDGGAARSSEELIEAAELEIQELRLERDQLKGHLAALEDDLLDAQADFDSATSEISMLQAQLAWRQIDGTDQAAAAETELLSNSPETIAQALDWATERLGAIRVHPDAARDIEDLDSAVNGPSWAELVWRGLRALDTYAAAGHDGDFGDWCRTSGHAWAWPATSKKLSMTESNSVMTRSKFSDQRLLPVDQAVEACGRVHMWAHLKIAEGGGPTAPRVYFLDDTRGTTGKVHIGFVGPHRYMENTKTN